MIILNNFSLTVLAVLLVTSLLVTNAVASAGDREPAFLNCIKGRYKLCAENSSMSFYDFHPFSIIEWDCFETAQYLCMRNINLGKLANNVPVEKYYGHWCFERYFGLEEPGSVLFSILNIIPHMMYVKKFVFHSTHQDSHTFVKHDNHFIRDAWLLTFAVIAVSLWTASTVFHSKKTYTTTLADYVTGFTSISYGFVIAIRRVFYEYSPRLANGVTIINFTLMALRIAHMVYYGVAFQDHFMMCVAIIATTSILWVCWFAHLATQRYWFKQQEIDMTIPWKCLTCQCLLGLSSLLEVLDFPAFLGVFDAHALWHAATVPLWFFWYQMWIEDAIENTNKKRPKELKKAL